MRVLVAYASKMGGTAGIAESIGDALLDRGVVGDVLPVERAGPPSDYDAVIVGSGLYSARWRRSARRYVRMHAESLRQLPVWFFSSGPLDSSATQGEIPPIAQVRSLMDRVDARGHVTFGGRLEPDVRGLPASAIANKHAGDWHDPEQIRDWALQVADQLLAVPAAAE